jgi:hypothetical protein
MRKALQRRGAEFAEFGVFFINFLILGALRAFAVNYLLKHGNQSRKF